MEVEGEVGGRGSEYLGTVLELSPHLSAVGKTGVCREAALYHLERVH